MKRCLALVLFSLALINTAAARAAEWTPVGPFGGTVNALAVAPSDPRVLYAGTRGAGIFRSTDGGRSWARRNAGLTDFNVLCLAVDPRAPATVYAGTSHGELRKSTDGGASWTSIAPTPTRFTSVALATDPARPDTVYVSYGGGVYKSIDGGAHWVRSHTGLESVAVSLAVDPRSPRTLYAGTFEQGVYKSVNGGANWVPARQGMGQSIVYSIAVDPRNPATVYAVTSTFGGYQIFKSADGGRTWRASGRGLPAGGRLLAVAVDPLRTAYVGTSNGVYKSTDGGARWRPANQGATGIDVGALAVHPAAPSVLWAGTGKEGLPGAGVYRTTNGGGSWAPSRRGLTAGVVSVLAVGPVPPDGEPAVYAGAPGQGIFGSTDGGARWASLNQGLRGGNVDSLLVHPDNPSILYAAGDAGVFRSGDGGATWQPRNRGLADSGGGPLRVFSLAFKADDPDTLFAGSTQAIYKSVDGGATWRRAGEIFNLRVRSIATSADDPALVYASGDEITDIGDPARLVNSTDAGETWTPLGFIAQQRLAVDPLDAAIVLAANVGHELARSVDGGATFEQVDFESPDGLRVTAVIFDPATPGLAYAAFTAGGSHEATFLFQSVDDGVTWTQVYAEGIGNSFVLGLALDDAGTLYAATRGGGIYRLEQP